MKKLIPLFTLVLLSYIANSQSPIESFEADINYADCQIALVEFWIEGSSLDWDSLMWHFGDGSVAKRAHSNSKSHSYSNPGVYSVSLDIWLNGIKKTIRRDSLIVLHNPMEVLFDVVPEDSSMIAPATLHFINQTIPGDCDSISYEWEIRPGKFYFYEKNMEFTFDTPGTYAIMLNAKDSLNCDRDLYKSVTIKDTIQRNEFPYIVSACQYEDLTMEDFKKNFEIIYDTLFIYGIIDKNCCTEKTATYRIKGDTVFIQTWESGERCTCSCPYKFRIVIPDIGKDSVYVYFDSNLYLAKSKSMGIEIFKLPDFKIFPNPVHTYFIIQSPAHNYENMYYEITSLSGKKLQSGYAQPGSKVNLTHSVKNAGFVAISVRVGKTESVFKVAIQK